MSARSCVCLASLLLATAACTSSSSPAASTPKVETLVLGVDLDRTGSIATPSWSVSIDVAVGTMNEALRSSGRPLRFATAAGNSGNDAATARASALDLVQKQHAFAIITDSSQDDIAVNLLAYDGHHLAVPVVCMGCTSAQINSPDAQDAEPARQAALRNEQGWNFRTTMSDAYQARMIARLLLSRERRGDANGHRRASFSLLATSDAYGKNFAETLRGLLIQGRPDARVEAVFVEPNVPAAYDFAGEVSRLLASKPDAAVEIAFPKLAIAFTKAWIDSGSKTPLLHTHNFRAARVLDALKTTIEGQEGTSQVVLADTASAAAFAQDLRARSGQAPAFRDATAYDAAMNLMLAAVAARRAVGSAAITGEAVRDAMRTIHAPTGTRLSGGVSALERALQLMDSGAPIQWDGASGPCRFDPHGDVVAELARFKVQGGRFVDVERFDCLQSPECPAKPLP